MSKLQDVENAVVSGKSKLVAGLVQEALDEGCSAPDILNGMINAMGIVGERFKKMKSLYLKCLSQPVQ